MENYENYGTWDKSSKTFTFKEEIRTVDNKVAKEVPKDVENLVGSGVETIGIGAFEDRKNLKTVNFQNATTIGGGAFGGCKNLKTADFPKVTTIGRGLLRNV